MDCRGELKSLNDAGEFPARNEKGLPLFNPAVPVYHKVKTAKRLFSTGSRTGNENPFLLSVGITWFRHHNWLARQLGGQHSDWSEEKVFNEARLRNIATLQKVVFYDWLPLVLGSCTKCGEITSYTGYKASVSSAISNVFQSAAMNYIDTMVPSAVFVPSNLKRVFGTCNISREDDDNTESDDDSRHDTNHIDNIRLCNSFWNSDEIFENISTSNLLVGLMSQIAEREDHLVCSDLRDYYYGSMEFSRMDKVAKTIQRGRDHGLPDYNTARKILGFKKKQTIKDINPTLFTQNEELLRKLVALHGDSPDNMDIYTGGMLESEEGRPGELFRLIIMEQIIKLRDGDRFWFENYENGLFTTEEISELHNVTFGDVIMRTHPDLVIGEHFNPFLWNEENGKYFCNGPMNFTKENLESCPEMHHTDDFTSSQLSFLLVFCGLAVFLIVVIALMRILGVRKEQQRRTKSAILSDHNATSTTAKEILSFENFQWKAVQISLGPGNEILVREKRRTSSTTKFNMNEDVHIFYNNSGEKNRLFLRCAKHTYDLVLAFPKTHDRNLFLNSVRWFFRANQISWEEKSLNEREFCKEANTKNKRDLKVSSFYQACLSQIWQMETQVVPSAFPENLINIQLSRDEFANLLQMKSDSLFVRNIFCVADDDGDGFISFNDFRKILVFFIKGSSNEKMHLLFNVFDLNKTGYLTLQQFKDMFRCMVDTFSSTADQAAVEEVLNKIVPLQLDQEDGQLNFAEFKNLLCQLELDKIVLPFHSPEKKSKSPLKRKVSKHDRVQQARKLYETKTPLNSLTEQNENTSEARAVVLEVSSRLRSVRRWFECYARHVFWVSFYCWITLGVFLWSFNAVNSKKSSGLGIIGGYAVPIARASAAALMFNISTLLLTMCKNILTFLRETSLHIYIPFDASIACHKLVAWMALFFTVVHIVSHGINFYSIQTQSPSDLICLFRDYWFPSDYRPTFVFWCLQTLTGLTGVILTIVFIIMYIFAFDYPRQVMFNWFQWTHFIGYISVYFFTILHGSGMLIQAPSFYYYFLVPVILYTFDKLYSVYRKKLQLKVISAEILPSDVTYLEFARPSDFYYKAGQWVRIACSGLSKWEYHPFTLSSSPDEETLKLHIRAVGPWTRNIRNIYSDEKPKIYLEGPFGEGHQDWYKYEVAVLVGGGIGVTPFASILKDLVHKSHVGVGIPCKFVYFLWVTRDQRQYEWLLDIIDEVEKKDTLKILHTNIFITQIPNKFDLRTTMLYMCEQHFQKISGKSMFTGLNAATHFGRPNFPDFFKSLSDKHCEAERIGVFSCGPPPMTDSVEMARVKTNKYKGPVFTHHFENF